MSPINDFNLLIHHHAICYRDDRGDIWLPSFIGRWVNAIAPKLGHIGLLLYESKEKGLRQEEKILEENVELISLGPPGRGWKDRIPRMRRLRKACARASISADGLLVRGVTPRQWVVWKETSVPHKAFLLVGEINRVELKWSITGLYQTTRTLIRHREVERIAHQGLLLTNSPGLVKNVEEQIGQPVHYVPTSSISENEFPPTNSRKAVSSPWKLLYCGRIRFEKGIRELLLTVAALNQENLPCGLDLVGSFTNQTEVYLKERVAELGIQALVQWHGRVPFGPELFSFYERADAFVLPTYSEGFPHVIWEAAAHSCPVIVSSVGGVPALWKHGKHGLLVLPQDVDALVEAVKKMLLSDDLRRRVIESAYRHAKNHTVEICAERLVKMLEEKWLDI